MQSSSSINSDTLSSQILSAICAWQIFVKQGGRHHLQSACSSCSKICFVFRVNSRFEPVSLAFRSKLLYSLIEPLHSLFQITLQLVLFICLSLILALKLKRMWPLVFPCAFKDTKRLHSWPLVSTAHPHTAHLPRNKLRLTRQPSKKIKSKSAELKTCKKFSSW